MPCHQKYCIKSMTVKIPILILFRFCLLCRLKNHLFCVLSMLQVQVVLIIQALANGFSSFQMILGRFRSFQIVLGRPSSFLRLFQLVLVSCSLFQMVSGHLSSFQVVLACFLLQQVPFSSARKYATFSWELKGNYHQRN